MRYTAATVNDVVVGRAQPIEPGATYVFDKAYVDYPWWRTLHEAGCRFVTRAKKNVPLSLVEERPVSRADRREAAIDSDRVVKLGSQQRTRLPILLRRIVLHRDDGQPLVILSNDLDRSARQIAQLYKKRWQIELLFRWIKQHLKIKTFLGRSENAIRLQIIAAMIAYLLLRIAAHHSQAAILALRFADLVRARLFDRRALATIDKAKPRPTADPHNQLILAYA
ncbi:MAG TPA: IS4 family transposase [Stellaceae bacterium]|nr:IS4 family transposase [Stellaceae bacterium]